METVALLDKRSTLGVAQIFVTKLRIKFDGNKIPYASPVADRIGKIRDKRVENFIKKTELVGTEKPLIILLNK